jgi:hypothetical protein
VGQPKARLKRHHTGDVASFPHREQRDAPDDANEPAGHCKQSDAWVALKTSLDVPAGQGVL